MDLKEEKLLGAAAASHWYYKSKASAVDRFLTGRSYNSILDVGSGSGFFARHILQRTPAQKGVCVDINYQVDFEESCNNKPLRFRRELSESDADLVLFMDVLEHVDDDADILCYYAKIVQSGTAFLLTVPAFQFLWSMHDVFLEHRRRYTDRQLEAVAKKAGLRVLKISYYFGFVFPIAVVQRLGERVVPTSRRAPKSALKTHHPITNAILAGLCWAELPLIGHNRVCGLSVFCLAQKP
jgi:SAM-dependent methyltransferase